MVDGERVVCDCCGRQIVNYPVDDKFAIGRYHLQGFLIDVNKHACFVCIKDPLLRYQYGLDKQE